MRNPLVLALLSLALLTAGCTESLDGVDISGCVGDACTNADGSTNVANADNSGLQRYNSGDTPPSGGSANTNPERTSTPRPLQGSMAQVALAAARPGSLELWGLDAQGNIYRRGFSVASPDWTSTWNRVDGGLDRIDIAASGNGRVDVVGVNLHGHIYHTSSIDGAWQGHWTQVVGGLSDVAVASKGDGKVEIWGSSAAGGMYRRVFDVAKPDYTGDWMQLHGVPALQQIDIGFSTSGLVVTGVDAAGAVHVGTGTSSLAWKTLAPNGYRHASVAPGGTTILVVSTGGALAQMPVAGGAATPVAEFPALVELDRAADGSSTHDIAVSSDGKTLLRLQSSSKRK